MRLRHAPPFRPFPHSLCSGCSRRLPRSHSPGYSPAALLLLLALLGAGAAGCVGAAGARQELGPFFATDPLVEDIVGQMSAENITRILQTMEAFETRHTLSDTISEERGVGAARRWLLREYRSYSPRLQVRFDTHVVNDNSPGRLPAGTVLRNIVAVLPGTDPELSKQHIILTGHYDSINLDSPREGDPYERRDSNRPAPGVNDDISGVATAMECARVFAQYEFPKTLIFMAVVAEENGLVGASLFAQRAQEQGLEIEAVLNMDMIGCSTRGGGAPSRPYTVRVFSEDPMDSPSRQIARYMEMIGERYVPEQDVDLVFRYDRFGRGGDHTAFNRLGYPGVRMTEANEDYNLQHSYNDTFENLDLDYLMRNARIEAATAATLALSPTAPVPMRLGRGEGYDAALSFLPAGGEGVSGYVVAIRATTEPRWTEFRWIGIPEQIERRGRTYHQVVLPHLDIDGLVFGIAAVAEDGRLSLVAPFLR